MTFVQRFGDALNLNVHFHVLALDGVFDADDPEDLRFVSLTPPDDAEILRVARGFARRHPGNLECLGLPARPPPVAAPAISFLLPDELPES